MISKSLDVYVWLKLSLERGDKTHEQLGDELGISASGVLETALGNMRRRGDQR